jgi:bacterioferritin (cytochrome b1)
MKNETGKTIAAQTRARRANSRRVWAAKKGLENVSRSLQLEKPVGELLDDYCKFVDCMPDYVANFALRKTLARDPEYKDWKATQQGSIGNDKMRQRVSGRPS